MFAVVSYNGKQYKVAEGKTYKIDLLEHSEDKKISFSDVLLIEDEKILVGTPLVEGAKVEAEIIEDIKDDKVSGIKFHAKKRYKRNLGHRQQYTLVKITKIKL